MVDTATATEREDPAPTPEQQADIDEAARRLGMAKLRIIPKSSDVPQWVRYPEGLVVPKGRRLVFMRFPSTWTSTPHVGFPLPVEDAGAVKLGGVAGLWRQCICWDMSVGDEKIAASRSLGSQFRFNVELTKQMVRVVDGFLVNDDGSEGPGNLEVFWEQLGKRCRDVLSEVWVRTHRLSTEEQTSFFEHCIALVTNAG